jgi:hypothetical protein
MPILFPTTLRTIAELLVRFCSADLSVTEDDVRSEMRRYLTATTRDAKKALADVASQLRPGYVLSEDGTAILVDTDDPTAPDGYGRTYYLTLTEIPR